MGTTYREINEIGEVEFFATPQIRDEGYGYFEGYGQHVRMVASMEYSTIEWEKEAFTAEENLEIAEYLDANIADIERDIIEDHDFEPDEPEMPDDYMEGNRI
jgi:hypothetical protein